MRIFADGSMRARCDHPSNDPEIEFAMVGRVYGLARDVFKRHGRGEPILGAMTWRDDP